MVAVAPTMMVGATATIVVVSCLLTVVAGPLWDFSQRAGDNMRDAGNYVSTSLTSHVEER